MRQEAFVQFISRRSDVLIPECILEKKNLNHTIERMNGYCIQDMSDLVDRISFESIKRQCKLINQSLFF